jgi:hypothetical protein
MKASEMEKERKNDGRRVRSGIDSDDRRAEGIERRGRSCGRRNGVLKVMRSGGEQSVDGKDE